MIARRWGFQDKYAAEIEAAAQTWGIPAEIAYGLVARESGFNAQAIGDGGRSYGLVQIQLTTARGLGFTGTGTGLLDPATNTLYGMQYLRGQLDRAGSIPAALSAYNGGYRPSSGYGAPRADGAFANQQYVDQVLSFADYFRGYLAERGAVAGGVSEAGPGGGLLGWILTGGLFTALLARLRKKRRSS